ncbi:hypothetical protein [Blastococcus sp. URHD0036]|uniref:hypothetical protein n=1 Tax=Blastococcus sp. URHD0036 TaxID=1380356 RepID=UPI0012DDB434|nr:hypothetical protein [Blastococcus sp. URHD0036]
MTTGSSQHRRIRGLAAAGVAMGLLAGCATDVRGEAAAATTLHDWRNATYSVTCDGIVPDGFPATLTDGAAWVSADPSRPPYYDHYEIGFETSASGDVDGDGDRDVVVLLQCSPQPSNGILEEAQVFTADGDRLGVLPSPRMLREESILAPLYDPAGLTVEGGDIVAAMTAYGPEDSHASGPSVPITVRWHWDGRQFVRVE